MKDEDYYKRNRLLKDLKSDSSKSNPDKSDDFANKISEDFDEVTEERRAYHIWNSTRFRFRAYDHMGDLHQLDDYGNLK